MLLTILTWIILGAIAGWIGSMLVGQNARVNGAMNVIVGILGAILGGVIFRAFGGSGVTGLNFYSFLVAIIGSVALLLIVNAVRRSSTTV